MMNGYNVDVNRMDATLRHPGMDWNSDGGAFQKFPVWPVMTSIRQFTQTPTPRAC